MVRVHVTDVAIAVLATFITVAVTVGVLNEASPVDRSTDGLAVVLMVCTGGALAFRRRVPVLVLGAATAATTAYLVIGYPYGPILACYAIAVYSVARWHDGRRAAWFTGASLAVLLTHLLTNDASLGGLAGLLPATAWAVVPYALGATRKVQVDAAARARSEAVRARLDEERLHIAQEVHDVVGHGLAAIQMQADVALHVLDRDPGHAVTALRSISRSSAAAFDELRSTLHLIRPGETATTAPAPGLARLDDLCGRIRDAGVDHDLEVVGTPRELAAPVDLAAYRILQEALTNVVRHSTQPAAHTMIEWNPTTVELTVANPGPTAAAGRGGLGLEGMYRRAQAVGGTLEAGPTPDGFRVHAVLPIPEAT